MSITAATLTRLAALRLAPEAMQEVLSIIASCIEPLEERRRRDRDRKKGVNSKGKSEENPQKLCGNSQEIPLEIPPMRNLPPKEDSSKAKKPSRSVAIEVPEEIPQSAVNFAVSKGWDQAKTRSEWDRFRNWSLNAGRKHKNLDAAWRNWVTSPYRTATGAQNGQRSHAKQSGESAVLAGLARAFGDRDSGSSGSADAEIPRGRFEFDAEPTRRS